MSLGGTTQVVADGSRRLTILVVALEEVEHDEERRVKPGHGLEERNNCPRRWMHLSHTEECVESLGSKRPRNPAGVAGPILPGLMRFKVCLYEDTSKAVIRLANKLAKTGL